VCRSFVFPPLLSCISLPQRCALGSAEPHTHERHWNIAVNPEMDPINTARKRWIAGRVRLVYTDAL
jgi:hypothetical protein